MASGAKRRKAAKKKKKEAAVINGNGEVKVNESDSGENSSSPASQDLEPQHNPFSKDEDKDPSPGNESKERSKKDGSWSVCKEDEVVEDMVGEAKSNNGELAGVTSTNGGALKSVGVDDGSQVSEKNIDGLEMPTPEKEHSSIFAESESLAKEVIRVKDAAHAVQVFESYGVVQEKVIDAEESSKKIEEKVHPSETSPDLKEPRGDEISSLSNTTPSGRPSGETFGKQVRQSIVHIGNGEYLTGNSDVHKSAEKEPLLLTAPRPVHKTSWTGCCGLVELFSGSS
ncbi:hypothetical protein QQ045_007374 [Rhodiola kirilowii]